MRNLLLTLAPCAAALLLACGGDNPPPNTADNAPSASASADMTPPPPADTTPPPPPSASAPPADTTPPPPPPPPPAITVAALKFTASGPGFVSAELQADGSIVVKGKTVAKITNNNEVDDANGNALFTVGPDGSLSGDSLQKKASFSGDDLSNEDGAKISIADDGTVTFTGPKGKSKTIGKIDNVSGAKRAAAIVVAWRWLTHEHKGGKKNK